MEKSPVEYDKIEISGTRPVSHRKHLPIGRHLEFLQAGQWYPNYNIYIMH